MPVLQVFPLSGRLHEHTGALRGEMLEIHYRSGRFWPPLAIQRPVSYLPWNKQRNSIWNRSSMFSLLIPSYSYRILKTCVFRGQRFINLQLLQPHLKPFQGRPACSSQQVVHDKCSDACRWTLLSNNHRWNAASTNTETSCSALFINCIYNKIVHGLKMASVVSLGRYQQNQHSSCTSLNIRTWHTSKC